MEKRSERKDTGKRIAVAVGVLAFLAGVGFGIVKIMGGDDTGKKRVMEVVQLRLIPPPPPPKVEPPPPPPKIVEQKIEPPQPKPDDKPKEEKQAPPPGPLALDAKGGPGSDGFGLGGKPGGSDYLTTKDSIGGDGGTGMRWSGYATMIQDEIVKQIHSDEELDIANFRGSLKLWLTLAGKINRVEIQRSTGNPQIDSRLRDMIVGMPALPKAPPPEMPQPVRVLIVARAQ
jgi:hypothetical protein